MNKKEIENIKELLRSAHDADFILANKLIEHIPGAAQEILQSFEENPGSKGDWIFSSEGGKLISRKKILRID